MARFPSIRRDPGENISKVETYTSQEEVEANFLVEEQRHQENLASDEKTRKATEKENKKRETERKKKETEDRKAALLLQKQQEVEDEGRKEREEKDREDRSKQLDSLSNLFDNTVRTGILGKLSYVIEKRDDIMKNAQKSLLDGFSSFFMGKTVQDQKKELDGMIRTSVSERLLTGEKYKIASEDPDEVTFKTPKKKRPFSPRSEPKTQPKEEPTPEFSIPEASSPSFEIPSNSEDNLKQVNLLERIAAGVENLYATFTSLWKHTKKKDDTEAQEKNVEGITSKFSKVTEPLTKLKKRGLDLSLAGLAGMQTLFGTLGSFIMTTLGSVGAFILKALPIAGLVTGLFLLVKDGIGGWFSAEKWGVSKVEGMVGGLIGGLDDGVWGAIKNGTKWALLGASIGSVVPVIGTFFGGLVGGLLGAILGYIGGEKVAQGMRDLREWIAKEVQEIQDAIEGFFKGIPGRVKIMATDMWNKLSEWTSNIVSFIQEDLNTLKDKAKAFVKKIFTFDYWFGEGGKTLPAEQRMESLSSMGSDSGIIQLPEIKVTVEPSKDIEVLTKSFDTFLESIESQPKAAATEAMTQRIYEHRIESSVTNNSSSSADYSRNDNSQVYSKTYNTASINYSGTPNPRNHEGSAFGTQSLVNGGFGNPSRY